MIKPYTKLEAIKIVKALGKGKLEILSYAPCMGNHVAVISAKSPLGSVTYYIGLAIIKTVGSTKVKGVAWVKSSTGGCWHAGGIARTCEGDKKNPWGILLKKQRKSILSQLKEKKGDYIEVVARYSIIVNGCGVRHSIYPIDDYHLPECEKSKEIWKNEFGDKAEADKYLEEVKVYRKKIMKRREGQIYHG